MEEIRETSNDLRSAFRDVYSAHQALGKLIRERSGLLTETTIRLLKIAI